MDRQVPERLLRSCRLVLRVASCIVPRRQRQEWFREWHGEVWHWTHFLVESERLSDRTKREVLQHCWGAFPDALWHRFNRVAVLEFRNAYPLTPGFCLLGCLAVLSALIGASPMPLSWWTFSPRLDDQSAHLLTVSLNWRSDWLEPELLRDEITRWTRSCPLIAQSGTYAWRRGLLRGPTGKEEVLSARVTPGIFELFGTRPTLGRTFNSTEFSTCASCVVVGNSIWRSQFHQSKSVVGQHVSLNGRQVEIIGVLPEDFRLPGLDISVYSLFGLDFQPRQPNLEWPGAVLRLRESVPVEQAKEQLGRYLDETGGLAPKAILDVLTQKDMQYQSLKSCALLIPVSILFLIISHWGNITRLRTTGPTRRVADILGWWLFFGVKSTLLILLVLIASVDVVQLRVLRFSVDAIDYAGTAATWVCLVGLTIALSWSVRDQLSRCRGCLRRFRLRIDLGVSVGTFGEPGGTELVCDGGHGVLHVPIMQSGSLDSERWTDLDESWRALSTAEVGVHS